MNNFLFATFRDNDDKEIVELTFWNSHYRTANELLNNQRHRGTVTSNEHSLASVIFQDLRNETIHIVVSNLCYSETEVSC